MDDQPQGLSAANRRHRFREHRRPARALIAAALAIAAASASPAPAAAQPVVPETATVEDHFDPKLATMSIAGMMARATGPSLFAGLMLLGDEPAPLDYRALLLGPAPRGSEEADHRICVSVRSFNDAYFGRARFLAASLPVEAETRHSLVSKLQATLLDEGYDTDRITMLGSVAETCERPESDRLVAVGFGEAPTRLRVAMEYERGLRVSLFLRRPADGCELDPAAPKATRIDCRPVPWLNGAICEMALSPRWAGEVELVALAQVRANPSRRFARCAVTALPAP